MPTEQQGTQSNLSSKCDRRHISGAVHPDNGQAFRALGGLLQLAACLVCAVGYAGTAHAQTDYFPSPVRIALGEKGELLVADSRSQLVVSTYPGKGRKPATVDVPGRPVSVASGWNRLYVGNERTQTVDVLDRRGHLLFTLGGEGFYIPRPSDISIDRAAGLVFVTDTANARVLVFDPDGALLRTIPSAGQRPLAAPTGVTVDPVRGEVLVSDFEAAGNSFMKAGGVLIYDYEGIFRAMIRGDQAGGYDFARPQGLAVNSQGLVYLVDSFRGQVLIFDRNTLQGVATLGVSGMDPGELLLPLDIVIDDDTNDVYVTNNRNQRIERYAGKGVLQ